jgi:hypothetical protein
MLQLLAEVEKWNHTAHKPSLNKEEFFMETSHSYPEGTKEISV